LALKAGLCFFRICFMSCSFFAILGAGLSLSYLFKFPRPPQYYVDGYVDGYVASPIRLFRRGQEEESEGVLGSGWRSAAPLLISDRDCPPSHRRR